MIYIYIYIYIYLGLLYVVLRIYTIHIMHLLIKGSLDEKLPSYEVLKMLRE